MPSRAVALTWGVACHSLFLTAILTSMLNMYMGMHLGLVRFPPGAAILWDLGLLLQFPLLHSFLLSAPGSKLLSRLAPLKLGRDLASTTFVIIASVQMLSLYLLWAPLGSVWWSAHGVTRVLITLVYLSTWLFLARSMNDAGMATQTGFLGWSAVFRGRRPVYDPMPTRGLFKYTRQPIYLAFALTTWTVPTWTTDQLILALWFTSYCVFGPYFKEKRYQRRYGEKFESYRKQTPYFLPTLRP
ncbi:MAG TPA: isoprenylcysteine carboxylmethyltransferase family protein [Phycisphaerales bacterium]|nr:isoprenylcysteine carboxylmethyltransferase family protein [Phycisphaerales bacterium]